MAAKLKDGLFLGDYEAAHDLEFVLANKITHVINCAGREIANSWERSGVRYLTYYWPESGHCIVFDEANAVLDEIYGFIEEAIDLGESVLLHSTDGVSRAAFCAAVYFMLKYRWALPKTMSYLQSKRPDLEPKPGFLRQLHALDASLQRVNKANARGKGSNEPSLRKASEWDPDLVLETPSAPDDEVVLANTYLNSQPAAEDVIIAAQSSALQRRVYAGASGAAQITRHGTVQYAPGPGGESNTRKLASISWIDDARRTAASHSDVPVSPGTRRPVPERPPTSSYNSLALGQGWVDASGASTPVTIPGNSSQQPRVSFVVPSASNSVSLAAAAVPLPASRGVSVRSILRGSWVWAQQGAGKRDNGSDSDGGGVRASSEQESCLGRGARGGAAAASPLVSASVGVVADSGEGVSGSITPIDSVGARARDATPSRPSLNLNERGAQRLSTPLGGGSSSDYPSSKPLDAAAVAAVRAAVGGGDGSSSSRKSLQWPSQKQQELNASQQMGGRPIVSSASSWSALSATQGPVRPTASALQQSILSYAQSPLADTLANLAVGNVQRSLSRQAALAPSGTAGSGGGGSGGVQGQHALPHETPLLLSTQGHSGVGRLGGAASGGSIGPAAALMRSASNRVRGYSPAPGKTRDKAAAAALTVSQPVATPLQQVQYGGGGAYVNSFRVVGTLGGGQTQQQQQQLGGGPSYSVGRPASASAALQRASLQQHVVAAANAAALSSTSRASARKGAMSGVFEATPAVTPIAAHPHALPQYPLFTRDRQAPQYSGIGSVQSQRPSSAPLTSNATHRADVYVSPGGWGGGLGVSYLGSNGNTPLALSATASAASLLASGAYAGGRGGGTALSTSAPQQQLSSSLRQAQAQRPGSGNVAGGRGHAGASTGRVNVAISAVTQWPSASSAGAWGR